MIVIDASVAAAWFFNDEVSTYARFASERAVADGALVPAIFPTEIGNAFLMGVRRGRLDRDTMSNALERLAKLSVVIQNNSLLLAEDIALAEKHGLSLYDAQYLALALRSRATLYTLDARLAAAAEAEKVLGKMPA